MVYCNGRPVLLVCDNIVYVKMLPEIRDLFGTRGREPDTGVPYKAAKPHYILDIEDGGFAVTTTLLLAKLIPEPKPKPKKSR